MQQSNNIQIIAGFTQNQPIVLGKEKQLSFTLNNISATEKAYNVTAQFMLADGLDLVSSIPAYTSVVKDTSTTYTTTNMKDFAPLEQDYNLAYNVESLLKYSNGTSVPFGATLTGVLSIIWDSMPRGSEDAGNIQYFNFVGVSLTTKQISVVKTLPQKYVKGAGNDILQPSKVFHCEVTVTNNDSQSTTCGVEDVLPNGVRYLGNITYLSQIQNPPPTPILAFNSEDGTHTLRYSSVTFLPGEVLSFRYDVAIYDKYTANGVENSGDTILHGTLLQANISLVAQQVTLDSMAYGTHAMDIIITGAQNKTIIDCGMQVQYTLTVIANQYHDINSVGVQALVPDGENPISYPGGTQGQQTTNYSIPINYSVGTVLKDTSENQSLTTQVLSTYRKDGSAVSCGDTFVLPMSVQGTNADSALAINDSSSLTRSIIIPKITKVITGRYYRDLTAKPIPAMAKLDYIEYELTYDSTGIQAAQKAIQVDDYFPLNDAIPISSQITQIFGPQITPVTVDPHGLRWVLGDVAEGILWKVRVQSQITQTAQYGSHTNLFKMDGANSSGETYFDRANVSYNIGRPNIVVTRSMSGIDSNHVESGQRYSATVTFSNTQTTDLTATDAFNFTVYAQLLNGVQMDPNSIVITGTGSWNAPVIDGEILSILVKRIKVGESISIYYEATIPNNIPPSWSADLISQSGVPYTQSYNIALLNVQYDMSAITTKATLRSSSMTLVKAYDTGVKQVGSTVRYTITATIPKGTAVYNYNIVDTLPTQQGYVGSATFNGNAVTPQVVQRVVTFPTTDYAYDAQNNITLTYAFTAKITTTANSVADSTQTNTGVFEYQDSGAVSYTKTSSVGVIVSNPLLTLALSSQTNTISAFQTTKLTLTVQNTGKVDATSVVVHAPVALNASFISANATSGTPTYNAGTRTVDLNIGTLSALSTVTLSYFIQGTQSIVVGDTALFSAYSEIYHNTLDPTKDYSAVSSNTVTLTAKAGVQITIYPPYRTQTGGYVMVSANSIAYVPYTIVNAGGAQDSFLMHITPSKYPYQIEYNGQIVETVPINTEYVGTPIGFTGVGGGKMVKFRLIFNVPDVGIYDRNPYTITVSSLGDPTVTANIFTDMVDP